MGHDESGAGAPAPQDAPAPLIPPVPKQVTPKRQAPPAAPAPWAAAPAAPSAPAAPAAPLIPPAAPTAAPPAPDAPLVPPATTARKARTPKPPKVRNPARRLKLLVAGVTLLALGLLGAGATAGFWLHERYGTPRAPVLALDTASADGELPLQGPVVLPDVVLLAEAAAQDALADAGVDLAIVTSKPVPWAGAAGRVVGQEPRRGARNPKAITLSVSRPTTVPKAVGLTATDVRATLEALGAEVATIPVYQPGGKVGQVLGVEPGTGAPLPDRVVLRVVGDPAAVYLDAVNPESGGCSASSLELGGRTFAHGMQCSSGSADSPNTLTYALGGGIDRLETTVAGPEDGQPVRLRVLLDGKVLATKTLAPGKVEDVALTLTGGKRLVFESSVVGDSYGEEWFLGDARLLGSVQAVDRQAAGG